MVAGYGRDFQNKLWACRELKQKAIDEAAELRAENAKLKKSIGRNFDWVEIDGERVYTSYDQKLREENAKLRGALKSIASNTCCEPCQEAALVARQALLGGKE